MFSLGHPTSIAFSPATALQEANGKRLKNLFVLLLYLVQNVLMIIMNRLTQRLIIRHGSKVYNDSNRTK